MWIKTVKLQNFRNFKSLDIELDKGLNVIIGNNGSGKSALLDAILVGASSFLAGISYGYSKGIGVADVRHETRDDGGILNRVDCYPVTVSNIGYVDGQYCEWTKSLNGSKSRTTSGGIASIKAIAKAMEKNVMEGKTVTLPLIAYYGTGRLWAQKKDKVDEARNLSSRFKGYEDCINQMTTDKQLKNWFRDMALQNDQEDGLPQFKAVQNAIEECFTGIVDSNDCKVRVYYRQKYGEIVIEYTSLEGETEIHPLSEMSDGYRTTLSMIADIAHRMALLNPGLRENILETPGVIIIDEIELHLHPGWQARILKDLTKIFPNIQFIVSTHSPAVISSHKEAKLILLEGNNFQSIASAYGQDTNMVLKAVMRVEDRPVEIAELMREFSKNLYEKNDEAERILNKLKELLDKDDPNLNSAILDYNISRMDME